MEPRTLLHAGLTFLILVTGSIGGEARVPLGITCGRSFCCLKLVVMISVWSPCSRVKSSTVRSWLWSWWWQTFRFTTYRKLLRVTAGPALKLDQARLTFHNQLTEEVHVFYTPDFCYKVKNQYCVSLRVHASLWYLKFLCLLNCEKAQKAEVKMFLSIIVRLQFLD